MTLLMKVSKGEAELELEQAGTATNTWAPLCILTWNHTAPSDPDASGAAADKHARFCQTPGPAWNILQTGSSARRGFL